MILARYEDDDGEVFFGEGLSVELAYENLMGIINASRIADITFWDADKLSVRTIIKPIFEVL